MSWLRRKCRDDSLRVRALALQQGMWKKESVDRSGLPRRRRGSVVPIEHCIGKIVLLDCKKDVKCTRNKMMMIRAMVK